MNAKKSEQRQNDTRTEIQGVDLSGNLTELQLSGLRVSDSFIHMFCRTHVCASSCNAPGVGGGGKGCTAHGQGKGKWTSFRDQSKQITVMNEAGCQFNPQYKNFVIVPIFIPNVVAKV